MKIGAVCSCLGTRIFSMSLYTEPEGRCTSSDPEGHAPGSEKANPKQPTIREGLTMQKMNPGYNFAKSMLVHNKAIIYE